MRRLGPKRVAQRAARVLAALCAGLALASPASAQSCRRSEAPTGLAPDTTLLLGIATGEHVEVPPGDVLYFDRSSLVPEDSQVPVRGYVVKVEAFHHPQPRGLAAVLEGSDAKAILVPWGTRGDCKTVRWDEAAGRWIASSQPAVFAGELRPVAASDGTPILDVYSAYFEPYPTARVIRQRITEAIRGGRRFLTAQEYFIFAAALPERDPDSGALADAAALRRWAEENPQLASRWPADETLETLREGGVLPAP